jgi:hypothetical protein
MKNHSKIFQQYLNNNSKILNLNIKKEVIGKTKYLPAFSKEWKNTVYSFNKNKVANLPSNTINLNKVIQSYFHLFYKNNSSLYFRRFNILRKVPKFLRRIFMNNIEIKHTNEKIKINIHTFNRERISFEKYYLTLSKHTKQLLLEKFYKLYKLNISTIYSVIKDSQDKFLFVPDIIRKKKYLEYKFNSLTKFIYLKQLYLKKIWTVLVANYSKVQMERLRRYSILYSTNQLKYNKFGFLPYLTNILTKTIPKKIEYNIINLKYIPYSPDIFTKVVASLLSKKRRSTKPIFAILKILNRAKLPAFVNIVRERIFIKGTGNWDDFQNKYKDLKVLSNLKENTLENLLFNSKETKDISTPIYQSIKYKNLGGIKLRVKGRLTKRYRADRSIQAFSWKGGLKNVDSSFKRLNVALFRGNAQTNTAYSLSTSKRRIGAFAVKGWIGGK